MATRAFVALCVVLCVASLCVSSAHALQFPQRQRLKQVSDVALGRTGSSALKCEGKLKAMKADFMRDQAARNKELAMIKAIRRMAAQLNGVKDLAQTADVETSRKHAEINGRNGVLDIINKMYNKIIANQRAQVRAIMRQKTKCGSLCRSGVAALKKVYTAKQHDMDVCSTTYNRKISAMAAHRTRLAEAKGALSAAKKHRSKQSALLQKELRLVRILLKHVDQLGSGATTDVALPQSNMDELKLAAEHNGEFRSVLELFSVPKQDVNRLRKLLVNLKNKILREMAGLQARVTKAKKNIRRFRAALSKAADERDAAHRALKSARSARNAARTAWKIEKQRCASSASQANVAVDVQESSGTEDAMLHELLGIVKNSQDERLKNLVSQLSGTADVQSGDDNAAMLAALLGALQGGNQKVGADLTKLLGALGSTDDAQVAASDVQDDGSDEALLAGLLGALESDKKGGSDMTKLLGALTGASDEDGTEDDVAQDDHATSDVEDSGSDAAMLAGLLGALEGDKKGSSDVTKLLGALAGDSEKDNSQDDVAQEDVATEDSVDKMNAVLADLLDVLNKKHMSDDDMDKMMQSISNVETGTGSVTRQDIEKVVKLADSTKDLKKIENALKALEKKG